jgi:alkylation response protein AidB-like acyl-CoA dehydrogenase
MTAMFTLTDEHRMLQDSARDFVRDKLPVATLRRVRDAGESDGFDRALWAEMAAMGWTGVLVPESHGGSDLGYRGLGLILEECGRTLAPSPLLSTAMIGATALKGSSSQALKGKWLPRIADGSAIVALAVDEGPHHAPQRTKTVAEGGEDAVTVSGEKSYVADGQCADLILVVVRHGGQLALAAVEAGAKGVTRTTLKTVDSRGAADIAFDGAPGAIVGDAALVERVLDAARAGLAAEMLGTATEAFEMTAEYLKTRTQFGQLIGSFQALQHRAGKMLVDLELTRSCVAAALAALEDGAGNAPELASLAKARACETLHLVSNETVQMHGGIGMTDAHDSGLYMKRARVAEALYGGASFHRDRYATLQGY